MNRKELEQFWRETLRSDEPTAEKFEQLANGVVDVFRSEDKHFREHLINRSKHLMEESGQIFDPEQFDLAMARAFVADEIGFPDWMSLLDSLRDTETRPFLFRYAIASMERGDFTALEATIGPDRFYDQIVGWYQNELFVGEEETLNEILSAAFMLGQSKTVRFLLNSGVNPYAGMKTGLAGPHYAASSGRIETVQLLIEKKISFEVENIYGGTVLDQALWSAINEHSDHHAEIIETLLAAGARTSPGTIVWWQDQAVPSAKTKAAVLDALRRHGAQ